MVIYEIFLDVFRPYYTLKDLGSVLFKWAALVMSLVAFVVAASSPTGDQGPIVQAVITVTRCVRVAQVGLILFLLVFSRYLGVSWKQHSFGLSMGLGLAAGVELGTLAFHVSGHASDNLVHVINLVAYNIAIIVWLGYALMKSAARAPGAELFAPNRWEKALPIFRVRRRLIRSYPCLRAWSIALSPAPRPIIRRPRRAGFHGGTSSHHSQRYPFPSVAESPGSLNVSPAGDFCFSPACGRPIHPSETSPNT